MYTIFIIEYIFDKQKQLCAFKAMSKYYAPIINVKAQTLKSKCYSAHQIQV